MNNQSSNVKPIETHYNGHRFRSRLEARWALLFDKMGWPYQYEIEGYDLGEAGLYLPDFWIPINPKNNVTNYEGAGYFIEIKGRLLTMDEKRKVAALAQQTKHTVKVFVGNPGSHISTACHHRVASRFPLRPLFKDPYEELTGVPIDLVTLNVQLGYDRGANLFEAMKAARKARFEYGEVPA